MTDQEKLKGEYMAALQKIVVENLTFYDAPVSEVKVRMHAAELAGLNLDDLRAAYDRFRKEKGRRQMPMPADVRALLFPQLDPREEATELAGKVLGALARHGWNWPDGYLSTYGTFWEAMVDGKTKSALSFDAAVALELGPFGGNVIRLMGGWAALHDEWAAVSDHGTLRAQIRDTAQSVINRTTPSEKKLLIERNNVLKLPPKKEPV